MKRDDERGRKRRRERKYGEVRKESDRKEKGERWRDGDREKKGKIKNERFFKRKRGEKREKEKKKSMECREKERQMWGRRDSSLLDSSRWYSLPLLRHTPNPRVPGSLSNCRLELKARSASLATRKPTSTWRCCRRCRASRVSNCWGGSAGKDALRRTLPQVPDCVGEAGFARVLNCDSDLGKKRLGEEESSPSWSQAAANDRTPAAPGSLRWWTIVSLEWGARGRDEGAPRKGSGRWREERRTEQGGRRENKRDPEVVMLPGAFFEALGEGHLWC